MARINGLAREEKKLAESNYQKVLASIPDWQPSSKVRVFGVTAIQSIVPVSLLEAIEIKHRLGLEGKLPKGEDL